MSYTTISIAHEGAIDWLTLNRPERLNAITPQMCDELIDYFRGLMTDERVRVVMLRGAGRAFCAGYDLHAAADVSAGAATGMRVQRQVAQVFQLMRRCPQPVICLAHGAATGGGFAFILASDVRVITPETRMNVAMVKVGMTGCDVGISYFLPRSVGQSVAAELMMTGRFLEPARAERLGLVSAVVDANTLEETGRALARDMLATSPLGLRLTKDGLNFAIDAPSLEAAAALEDRGQILCATAGLFAEGISAFLEKRAPDYPDT
jgi:enoyl-CoA hydratase/carnithine racemase